MCTVGRAALAHEAMRQTRVAFTGICIRRFGIESADRLEWRNWAAGTEYTKSYLVKNVSTDKTVQITYNQTASKSFSMEFPEPFKLRPGMSQALKVPPPHAHAYVAWPCCMRCKEHLTRRRV